MSKLHLVGLVVFSASLVLAQSAPPAKQTDESKPSPVGASETTQPKPTYQDFHFMIQLGTPDNSNTNRTFSITSNLPGVSPSDIVLTIHSTNREYHVRLNEFGYPVDFPLTPELWAENPPVTVNQPKGSLYIFAGEKVSAEDANGPIFQAYMKLHDEAIRSGIRLQDETVTYQALHYVLGRWPGYSASMAENAPDEAQDPPVNLAHLYAKPVVLEFKGTPPAGIRCRGTAENFEIHADADGLVTVPVSETLWAANPWIEFYPNIDSWYFRGDKPVYATLSLRELFERATRRSQKNTSRHAVPSREP